jgi:energy-coupling factor transporter ATP-binding protein EcfA2
VLDDLSLEIAAGSVTGLLGPSGSGKSTLIRAIVGVQIVEGGEVVVLGSPAGSPPLRSRVGYVTQAPSVYGDLTVRENLGYFGRILRVPLSGSRRYSTRSACDRRPGSASNRLSGGQRARVSLATALLNRPELLVLDEPTVGLDPVLRRDLWQLFHSLAETGSTLLVSSHVMDEASAATRCCSSGTGSRSPRSRPTSCAPGPASRISRRRSSRSRSRDERRSLRLAPVGKPCFSDGPPSSEADPPGEPPVSPWTLARSRAKGVPVSPRIAAATAARVLRQLRHDPRTVALVLVVPAALVTLVKYVFEDSPVFDRIGDRCSASSR